MGTLKDEVLKEKAIREAERRYSKEREDLLEFIKTYFRNERPKGIKEFEASDFHRIIADKLERALNGEFNRLIINIPPWHGKTELITKSFPVWAMWKNPYLQIIATGYSTTLTQWFSAEAKDYYKSNTFKRIFPRNKWVKKTQDTKEHRQTEDWAAYYATGFDWSITGKRANIFIIDDPIKPNEADKSEVVRTWVNNLFLNTVPSRLFDPAKDLIIIIMQRTHDDDLCGFLINRMEKGWEKWEVLSMPAIAEVDEQYETKYWTINRKKWDPLDPVRFPISTLDILRNSDKTTWSTQYQQEPVNKDTQEFHEEWYKYYNEDTRPPLNELRIFTTCDPAFTKNTNSDYTAIVTWWFRGEELYILEYTQARLDPSELINKLIYHIRKREPERIWIEAFQAQQIIWHNLGIELEKHRLYTIIEDIRQTWDKEAKIRKLIYHYKNWHIFHTREMQELEFELRRFPRWQHDDLIDALQMLYDLYKTTPNTINDRNIIPQMQYDSNWRPYFV